MKTIKISKILSNKGNLNCVTILPVNGIGYIIEYFFKQKTSKGICKVKKVIVENVINDINMPKISNDNVKHLGYNEYYYYTPDQNGFYINFYKH